MEKGRGQLRQWPVLFHLVSIVSEVNEKLFLISAHLNVKVNRKKTLVFKKGKIYCNT